MKLLLLHSLTGGGHLAAARAVAAALEAQDPSLEIVIVDGLAEGTRWPFRESPRIYASLMGRARWVWGLLYHLTNGPIRSRLFVDFAALWSRRRMRKLLLHHQADLIASTHPLLTRLVRQVARSIDPHAKIAVIVTDLVTGNFTWYDREADRLFVPSIEVRDRLATAGYDMQRVRLTGQPVHPKCATAVAERDELRQRLGWNEKVILVVGGGDGMGDIEAHAAALDQSAIDELRIVIICGRNEPLRKSLDARQWEQRVDVLGFVENLHELMAAADLLVTKGGPGTIIEGCVAGLPILIFDYLPGQEIGNVRFVENREIGALASNPNELAQAAADLLADPERRRGIRERAQAAGHPESAHQIAQGLRELLG